MPEYIPPEQAHAPAIKSVVAKLGREIMKESGASKVIVYCKYELSGGKDELKIKMQVSNDGCMERGDASPPQPKGDGLTKEAEDSVRDILDNKSEGEG